MKFFTDYLSSVLMAKALHEKREARKAVKPAKPPKLDIRPALKRKAPRGH